MIMLLLYYFHSSVTIKSCLTLGNSEDIKWCTEENNHQPYFQHLKLITISLLAPHLLRKISTFYKSDTYLL